MTTGSASNFATTCPTMSSFAKLVTAKGSTWHNGAATLYRDRRSPDEITTMVSQLFLGVRLECAKCHHHPFESYSQTDFYQFAAYFARVGRKGTGSIAAHFWWRRNRLQLPIVARSSIRSRAKRSQPTPLLRGAHTRSTRPILGRVTGRTG